LEGCYFCFGVCVLLELVVREGGVWRGEEA
jgi:hypothetical protein